MRIIGIILSPGAEWERVRAHPPRLAPLLATHVLPLSLLCALAAAAGPWTGTAGVPVSPAAGAWARGGFGLFCALASVAALTLVFHGLAGMMAPQRRGWRAALLLAAYGSTPALLATPFLAFASTGMLLPVGALHALYLYYHGARIVLGIAEDECAEFVALSALGAGALLFLLGAAAGALARA